MAATGYFHKTKFVTGTGTAKCPVGWRVTGGGYEPAVDTYKYGSPNLTYDTETKYTVKWSRPSGRSWQAQGWKTVTRYFMFSTNTDSVTTLYKPKVYAVCVR